MITITMLCSESDHTVRHTPTSVCLSAFLFVCLRPSPSLFVSVCISLSLYLRGTTRSTRPRLCQVMLATRAAIGNAYSTRLTRVIPQFCVFACYCWSPSGAGEEGPEGGRSLVFSLPFLVFALPSLDLQPRVSTTFPCGLHCLFIACHCLTSCAHCLSSCAHCLSEGGRSALRGEPLSEGEVHRSRALGDRGHVCS